MKKLMGILLAASMVFSLAACGSTADTAASSAAGTTATAEGSSNNQAPDVKVGAIILGDETEGYSAAHINGIKEAAAELGMSDDQIVWKYKIAEGGVTADAAEDLVGQGCNLIISNSYGHQTYMEEEAEKYPDINFVAMTGDFAAISGLDNFYNAFTAVYQSRYVSGVVAGMKVKELVEYAGKAGAESRAHAGKKCDQNGQRNVHALSASNSSFRLCSMRCIASEKARRASSSIPANSLSEKAFCSCRPRAMMGCAFSVQRSSVFRRSPSTPRRVRYPSRTSRSTLTETKFALMCRISTISLAVL